MGVVTGEFRYKAFISYSWADLVWGDWLHRALETYRPPKGAADGRTLHPVFKDREEEAAGASIGAAIEAAMAASEFLIVVCSPNSAASKWVNREVAWFKTHRDPAKILAVIVGGEPLASATPGREAEECFPKTASPSSRSASTRRRRIRPRSSSVAARVKVTTRMLATPSPASSSKRRYSELIACVLPVPALASMS